MQFHQWKKLYFGANFTEVCPWGSNWQKVSIGSGNGLAPNRRQAITWTNVEPVHGRIYAALGGAKVIHFHQRPQAKCDNFLSTSLLSAVSRPFYYLWTIIRPFHENQYASTANHSTKLSVKYLIDRILFNIDNKKFHVAILMDLSREFGMLDHKISIEKLHHYGIKGIWLMWFESYLSPKTHTVPRGW